MGNALIQLPRRFFPVNGQYLFFTISGKLRKDSESHLNIEKEIKEETPKILIDTDFPYLCMIRAYRIKRLRIDKPKHCQCLGRRATENKQFNSFRDRTGHYSRVLC